MLREVIAIVTETTEVDHLAQPSTRRSGSEGGRAVPVPDREVAAGQGVHEVVGGLLALQRLAQALCIADVGVHRPPRPAVAVGTARQRRHVVAIIRQRSGHGGTDKPRRPRHGNPHRAQPQLGASTRRLNTMRHRTQPDRGNPASSTRVQGLRRRPRRAG